MNLNLGWLSLRCSDLVICLCGIGAGLAKRLLAFEFDDKASRFNEECRFSGSYPSLKCDIRLRAFRNREKSVFFVR